MLNTENLVPDKTKQKIFFGEYSGFQRFDSPTYDFAVIMEEKQRNAFWNPQEITLSVDRLKFFDLPEHIQEIMIRIWLFQTLMDSAQNSGLEEVIAGLCTNPEFEAMFKSWGYFELIHSISYSHILRGIFSDASKIFDRIQDYPEIQKRIDKEIDLYTRVKNIHELDNETDKKKLILELLVNIYALEGVKFYGSFLVTYVINDRYQSPIPGSTRIIKLITFDENLHTTMCLGTINTLKKFPSEGFSELINSDWFGDLVYKTLSEVANSEIDFAKYLLSFGNIPGLTLEVFSRFIRYYTDVRCNDLIERKIFNQESTDIVTWFENYQDLNLDNAALQESDLSAYSIGILKNDLEPGEFMIDFAAEMRNS